MALLTEVDGCHSTVAIQPPTYQASGMKRLRRRGRVDASRFGSQSSGRGLVEGSSSPASELLAAAAASSSAPRRVKRLPTLEVIPELPDSDTGEGEEEAGAEAVDFTDRSPWASLSSGAP